MWINFLTTGSSGNTKYLKSEHSNGKPMEKKPNRVKISAKNETATSIIANTRLKEMVRGGANGANGKNPVLLILFIYNERDQPTCL